MPVLVTGATGHIGNTVSRILIDQGREVRALVRSTSDTRSLRDLDLERVEANILVPESLEQAVRGCNVVYHAAAVHKTWSANPELEIIRPAVEGTRNILQAAKQARVKKIIYVSSAVAMGGGDTFHHQRSVDDWFPNPKLPCNIAKTRSEQVAHQLAEELELNVVFVLPGMVLGSHDYSITPSTAFVRDFLRGKIPFYFNGGFTVVHVEDVARGMLLAETRGLSGSRYILGGDQITVQELLNQLAEMTKRSAPALKFSKQKAKIISYPMKWTAQITRSPAMLTPAFVEDHFDRYFNFSSERSREALGYEYRALLRVLEDTINWLINQDVISPNIREIENL